MLLESVLCNLNIEDYIVKSKKGNCVAITLYSLVESILETNSGPEAAKHLGVSPQTFNRTIKKAFPEVSLTGGNNSWKKYLISKSNYKFCGSCDTLKNKEQFGIDNCTSDKLSSKCKECKKELNKDYYESNKDIYHKPYYEENKGEYLARAALRKAAVLQRTPRWADLETIERFYWNCPKGYHVDHIFPLQGKLVSGLHVIDNLQYLTAKENLEKYNKFTPL